MTEQEPIIRSAKNASEEPFAEAPLQVVLGERGRRGPGMAIGAVACLVLGGLFLLAWLLSAASESGSAGFWGVSLASIIFWLSVTQGLLAVSALLRLAHASWRYSLTRMMDLSSLFIIPAILVILPLLYKLRGVVYGPLSSTGNGQPVGDAGHLTPLFGSEKLWRTSSFTGSFLTDCLFILTAYIVGYLLLRITARPDFAALRDRAPENRRGLFRRLAGNWIGSSYQWNYMRRQEAFLMVGVVMTFFASQTVLGWDFQLSAGREWDSSIFPFQMSLSGLLAGTAMLTLLMTAVRSRIPGSKAIGDKQYDSIGKLMIALGLIFFYFRWCDYITAWYGHTPDEWSQQLGRTIRFPLVFTMTVIGCMAIPIFANIFGRVRRSPFMMCCISLLILAGVWCQFFLNTVPALSPGYAAPISFGAAATGLLMLLGLGSLFLLIYFVFIPLYSSISWWGWNKWNTRSALRPLGNATVTVMVEDPPVWEN